MKFHEISFHFISREISRPHAPLGTTYALPGRYGPHRRDATRGHRQQHAAPREGEVPQLLPASSRTAAAFSPSGGLRACCGSRRRKACLRCARMRRASCSRGRTPKSVAHLIARLYHTCLVVSIPVFQSLMPRGVGHTALYTSACSAPMRRRRPPLLNKPPAPARALAAPLQCRTAARASAPEAQRGRRRW